MAISDCTGPTPGKFIAVGIFLADDCGVPIDGVDMGWVDWCPAALSIDPQVNEGDDFQRECANGAILNSTPGVDTLTGVDWELDLQQFDPDFLAAVSGATPVTFDGETVGWDTCKDSAGSASIFLWREVAGDPCEGGAPQYLLKILPWSSNVRITEEGTFGAADAYLRLTGTSRLGHGFGLGPLPYQNDPLTPGTPACPEQPIGSDCPVRDVLTTLPPPDECGFVEVTACVAP